MAENQEKSAKIPILSVLKRGSVLKNIFLSGPGGEIKQEHENRPILIGRHPECHVIVDHPSISRFHLEIRAKPSEERICVVDRGSVHGTWISGTKIEPNVPFHLKEGDLIKLGASTREYRLHWLSVNEAFEMEAPLPPLLEEKEESQQDEIHEEKEQSQLDEIHHNEELTVSSKFDKEFVSPLKGDLPVKSESIGSNQKGSSSSLLSRREKSKSISSLTIQTGKNKENVATKEKEEENCGFLFAKFGEDVVISVNEEKFASDKQNVSNLREEIDCEDLFVKLGASLIGLENEENFASEQEIIADVREEENCRVLFAKLGASLIGLDNEESFASDKENMTPQDSISKKTTRFSEKSGAKTKTASILSKNFNEKELESECLVSERRKGGKSVCILGEVKQNSSMKLKENGNCSKSAKKSRKEKRNSFTEILVGNLNINETEYFDSDKENLTPLASKSAKKSRKILGEAMQNNNSKSSLKGSKAKKLENQNLDKKENKSFIQNERTSPARALLKNVDFKGGEDENRENLTPVSSKSARKSMQLISENRAEMSPVRALFKNADFKGAEVENCEIFCSDKENLTPASSKGARKLKQPLSENRVEMSPVRTSFKNADLEGTEVENCELFCSDKENLTPVSSKIARKLKQPLSENRAEMSPVRTSFQNADLKGAEVENCEIYCCDKENLTPASSKAAQKLKKPLIKNEDSKGAEVENCEIFYSDKENLTPASSKVTRKLKQPLSKNRAELEKEISEKKKFEREPFDLLFDASQNTSFDCGPANQLAREKKVERKVWNMIVDAGCLLNEESFKALKLLQGLKGTRLIIPNIVIRELDCMKRRESIFTLTRPHRAASKILKWIEELMESWWAHVQGSSETLPVARTPPVTPTAALYGERNGSNGFGINEKVFSPCGGYMEIVTPTSEDHVLDCALFFRKLRRSEEFVIVSSSTTLKIKAMAEGLLCEEAKEFRESLVNPFSKRFMWGPRGPALSPRNADVAGIAGDCNCTNPVFARRAVTVGESVKGLKLILHHNSHYGLAV